MIPIPNPFVSERLTVYAARTGQVIRDLAPSPAGWVPHPDPWALILRADVQPVLRHVFPDGIRGKEVSFRWDEKSSPRSSS